MLKLPIFTTLLTWTSVLERFVCGSNLGWPLLAPGNVHSSHSANSMDTLESLERATLRLTQIVNSKYDRFFYVFGVKHNPVLSWRSLNLVSYSGMRISSPKNKNGSMSFFKK